MNASKFFLAYLACLLLIFVSVFGVFHQNFIDIGRQEIGFYIQISSAFVFAVALLLLWHYAGVLVRSKTTKYFNDFIHSAINLDTNKVSLEDMNHISSRLLFLLDKVERCRFLLYMFVIPFFVSFLTLCILIFLVNKTLLLPIFVSAASAIILVNFAVKIVGKSNLELYRSFLSKFSKSTLAASRGIQFYMAQDFVNSKFNQVQESVQNDAENVLSNCTIGAFFRMCGLFFIICLAYVINEDYISDNLFDLSNNSNLFYSAIFFFLISLLAYTKYLAIKDIDLDAVIPNNCLLEPQIEDDKKQLDIKNLFLAFHKVCFQDPTKVTDVLLLNDVSFSILPGEFIAIIGENAVLSTYIFDLILKYYKPQTGAIYIGGTKIGNISSNTIRSVIGIFRQDFGLINGTVLENLAIVSNDRREILKVAERVSLQDVLDTEIFDEKWEISLSQEILLRIQMARIFIQEPSILLIESPAFFETQEVLELFNSFVSHISKRKTVIMTTNSASFFVYSDKILYLGKESTLFGPHAELCNNKSYQRYISGRL